MTGTDGEVQGSDESKACENKSGEDSKSDPGRRRKTRLEVQTSAADGINRMADKMEMTKASNATLIKEHVALAKASNLHLSARKDQKAKMHDVELSNSKLETRKKQLDELAFHRYNSFNTQDEFIECVKAVISDHPCP